MLPSGAVTIDGKVYNAVTSGMPIDAGQPVRIVKIDGKSMVVHPHDGPIDPDDASPEAVLGQAIESLGIDPFEEDSPGQGG